VIFNDYKNRTHDKKEELLINTGLALGAIALAPSFALNQRGQWNSIMDTERHFT
jgi:hypothetical protein